MTMVNDTKLLMFANIGGIAILCTTTIISIYRGRPIVIQQPTPNDTPLENTQEDGST